MAMAMGVASLGVAAVPRNQSLVCRASATNTGEKTGFLDWFRQALDKDSLRETDELLGKVDGGKPGNDKAAASPKKGPAAEPEKKSGFNFFGKK